MNENEFNQMFDEDKESSAIKAALLATQTGMDTMHETLQYFIKMLVLCMQQLCESSGQTMSEVRTGLEQELGFEGQLEIYLRRLQASREVMQDLPKVEGLD